MMNKVVSTASSSFLMLTMEVNLVGCTTFTTSEDFVLAVQLSTILTETKEPQHLQSCLAHSLSRVGGFPDELLFGKDGKRLQDEKPLTCQLPHELRTMSSMYRQASDEDAVKISTCTFLTNPTKLTELWTPASPSTPSENVS